MYETVLFDGTDVRSFGVRHIAKWDGVLATPSLRGDDLTVVDSDGEHNVADRAFGAFDVPLNLTLLGGTVTTFNDATRALRRLVKVDGTVTMTRRLSFTSGNEEHTCRARYNGGLTPELIDMAAGQVPLVMRNLDGLWYGPSTTISNGSVTVAGDVRTRRMTVTFTNGTNPTLTNATTGDALTFTGSPGAGGTVVNVEAMTAVRSSTDVSGLLSWTRTFPMTLAAGANTLSLSGGGTVSISYQGAFL